MENCKVATEEKLNNTILQQEEWEKNLIWSQLWKEIMFYVHLKLEKPMKKTKSSWDSSNVDKKQF